MSENNWFDNPALSGIDPGKLQMLTALSEQMKGKSQPELLSFLMSAARSGNNNSSSQNTSGNQNASFSQNEIDAIIGVLKIGKSPREIQKIDRMYALLRQLRP